MPAPGHVACAALVAQTPAGVVHVAADTPEGLLTPAHIHSAYLLPTLTPLSGGKRKQQTIAIVDVFNDPDAFADLTIYDKQFGLPVMPKCTTKITTSCFEKRSQTGSSTVFPDFDEQWALEESLDVQVAHATCQNCRIILVEANSTAIEDLNKAENTAIAVGATVVSNSFLADEYSSEAGDVAKFWTHPHVPLVAASGDNGLAANWPAVLPQVVAVGGTRLSLTPAGKWLSETAWDSTGAGCSKHITTPAFQKALAVWPSTGCKTARATNDVAADGDPATGAPIYDGNGYLGKVGWIKVGGTSLATPIIAATYALAANGAKYTYPTARLYNLMGTPAFHDPQSGGVFNPASGNDGQCAKVLECNGAPGYDLPTGVGTPRGIDGF